MVNTVIKMLALLIAFIFFLESFSTKAINTVIKMPALLIAFIFFLECSIQRFLNFFDTIVLHEHYVVYGDHREWGWVTSVVLSPSSEQADVGLESGLKLT